jgi:hypothetical protein
VRGAVAKRIRRETAGQGRRAYRHAKKRHKGIGDIAPMREDVQTPAPAMHGRRLQKRLARIRTKSPRVTQGGKPLPGVKSFEIR